MSSRDARYPRAYLLVHLALTGLAFALAFGHARDPDLGFHLATDRSILALGRVPGHNVLTFAEPEAFALQSQWLAAVFFELSYRAFGIAGPIGLKCVVIALTVMVLVETARARGARASATLLVGGLAILVAAERFVERPLIFSNLLLAFVAYYVATRDHAPRPRALAAVTAVGLALGVHLHGGAVFAFMLLFAVVVLDALSLVPRIGRVFGRSMEDTRRALRLDGAVLLSGAVLAALSLFAYHPHALEVMTVPFQMAGDPFLHRHLVEFRPPVAFPPRTLIAYWVMVGATALGIVGWVALFGRADTEPPRRASFSTVSLRAPVFVLPMLFGLALSLRHVRFVDLFAYLAAPALAALLSRVMAPSTSRPVRGEMVALALALVVFVAGGSTVLARDQVGVGYDPYVFPIALMRDLRGLGARGPAYVQDGWAGPYLGFRYPRERVFFHPAFECYSTRFFREEYLQTRDGAPGWEATLRRHDVRLVLMKYTSEGEARRQGGRPNLRQQLARDQDWALVTFDDYGLAFVRRDAMNERLHAAEIEALDADTHRFLGEPRRALSGLAALEARGMASSRSRALVTTAIRLSGSVR